LACLDNPEYRVGNAAFLQALGELGWIVGRNVRIDYRWGAGDVERYRAIARRFGLAGAGRSASTGLRDRERLAKGDRSVPIVFVDVIDPVGGSLVASLVRLGGNTTGVSILASELDVKRLEILHEFIPQARRIAMLIDTTTISTRAELSCAGGTRPCARAGYATRRPQVCGVSSSAMVAAWTSSLVPVTP
jgi:putative tryptophan/tyrosine transport system substrate-binding protein